MQLKIWIYGTYEIITAAVCPLVSSKQHRNRDNYPSVDY